MKTMQRFLISAACLMLFVFVTAAADSVPAEELPSVSDSAAFEDDIFGSGDDLFSFDSLASSGAEAKTEILFGGTVAASVNAVYADENLLLTAAPSGKVFAKISVPDYGSIFVSYAVSHTWIQSLDGDAPINVTASSQYDPQFALSELYYSFDIGKKMFIRIGNQLAAWGPSFVWTPVDFINLQKSDSFAQVDTRAGKSLLRFHVPFERANIFLLADFSELDKDAVSSGYGSLYENVNLAFRADAASGGFEFGVTGYGGYGNPFRAGLDFSGSAAGFTIYGEASYTFEGSGFDQVFQASAGFSRAFGELKLWTVSAEGFFNSAGVDNSGLSRNDYFALPSSQRTPLYQGMYYAFASIKRAEFISKDADVTLSCIANLQDMSYSVKLAGSFAFSKAVPFTASLSYAGGGDSKEFTYYGGNHALTAQLGVTISF